MNAPPLVSIVIPVHNHAALTRRCLDNLLSLSARVDFEVIVVDDGSTDSTPQVLERYGSAVRVVSLKRNSAFAAACNAGAAIARADNIVFLNNDTIAQPGWLDALYTYAAENQQAAATGAKLLFSNDTVQHAGVAICSDGMPRHIYAGFPANHPAVSKSRRFQAVTGAAMLVRRAKFEECGGFDTDFRNCFEDIDLCLRIGEKGYEVHYCADSVLYHLESVSVKRGSGDDRQAQKRFIDRYQGRLRADELDYYVADGLLRIQHDRTYPLQFSVAPELGIIAGKESGREASLLEASRQVVDLLHETTRLSVAHFEQHQRRIESLSTLGEERRSASQDALHPTSQGAGDCENQSELVDASEILKHARQIELEIAALQHRIQSPQLSISPYLRERELLKAFRQTVVDCTPVTATVVVVSKGDDELIDFPDRQGAHFPQSDDGVYCGYHPASSSEAVTALEAARARGGQYFAVPFASKWWLEYYSEFAQHLSKRYCLIADRDSCCTIYDIQTGRS